MDNKISTQAKAELARISHNFIEKSSFLIVSYGAIPLLQCRYFHGTYPEAVNP